MWPFLRGFPRAFGLFSDPEHGSRATIGGFGLWIEMNAVLNIDDEPPLAVMQKLVERHGRWSVLRAMLALVLRPRPKRVQRLPEVLNNHLLRDLGLPPVPEAPRDWGRR